ncbi:GPI anchored CFEM domain protein [Talaromyces stipitatus ATCC 10500]|uniref:GPI anchored CFEM domain protein n=1 Tax=Talaromyces stipitatus (strain ATCC 10500 / CBS 375.48 / QM 6759 / NRRL 1006) TaxID=441959 RepID=B8MQ80_TALSN|nr:GPI anchored CFEM domain protein [Talaromyces stipitatus ATCC 10500]EED13149.1 GPI anchored CFEM domain protein [Talaromyces stipitatus ATCC 10500]
MLSPSIFSKSSLPQSLVQARNNLQQHLRMQLKYLTILISTLGLTQAQLPHLPGCSLSCFLPTLQNDGCSSLTNFTCHCAVPGLVSSITPCVQSACDLSDQSSVSNAVTSLCSSAGVPISIPPVTGSTTGPAAATASTTTVTTSGTPTPSKTSCPSKASSSSSTSAVGGGGASTSGSSVTSAPNSETTSTSTFTGTSSGASTTTHTTTTSTRAAQSTGAAGSVSASFVGTGLFAMGVAAMFAL